MTVDVGSQVGNYRLESRSGAGQWFTASETGLGREVAIRVGDVPEGDRELVAARAKALATIEDTRLLPVYAYGGEAGVVWLATRQVDGRSLRELGRLERARVARLGAQLAGQLAALESRGLAPAELSPDDVVVEGDAERERAWLLPDPLRDVTSDSSVAARSLSNLLDATAGGGLVKETGTDLPTLTARLETVAVERRPRTLIALGIALAAAALAAGVVALVLATRPARRPHTATGDATAAATVVARIPLDASVGKAAAAASGIWIGTGDGTILHVDPATNRVEGAPLHVAPKQTYVQIALGGANMWAAAGRQLLRLDEHSGAVLGRTTLPQNRLGYSVAHAGGTVWVSAYVPRSGHTRPLRFDARTLRLLGAGTDYLGGGSFVGTTRSGILAVNSGPGEVVRTSADGERTQTVFVGAAGGTADLAFGKLWVPTGPDGTVAVIDPATLDYVGVLRLPGQALAVTHLARSIWVLTSDPSRIYRVDPKTLRQLGRPASAPRGSYTLVAGAGSLWVDAPRTQSLDRLRPSTPAPPPAPSTPAARGVLQNGPVPARKRLAVTGPGWRFTVEVHSPGWVASLLNSGPGQGQIYSVHKLVALIWIEPTATFGSGNRLVPLKRPLDWVTALRRNPAIAVTSVEHSTHSDASALLVKVDARPRSPFPRLCAGQPCVVVAPMTGYTYALGPGRSEFLVRQVGAKVLVLNLALVPHMTERETAQAESLLDSVRFTR